MRSVLAPLSAMMLVQTMTAMAVVAVPVLAPEIAASLDIDTAAVGLYQSTAFVGAAFFTLLSGSLVLRHGGVRVNQASVVISAAGVGLAVTGSVPVVALGAVLAGIGYGLATPAAEITTLAWLTLTPPWRSTSDPLSSVRNAAPTNATDW